MDAYRDALNQNWQHMLGHQLPALPSLGVYLDALAKFFGWLYGQVQTVAQQLAAFPGEGRILRPAYGRLGPN